MRKLVLFVSVLSSVICEGQVSINANPTQGCSPQNVNFAYVGPASDQWNWDFGDGSPNSTAQNPTHIYTQPGQYWVNMSAWNSTVPLGSAQIMINVAGIPAALTIEVANICVGDVAVFGFGNTGNINVSDIDWYYGDGNNTLYGSNMSTEHTYAAPGTYNVMARVTSPCGIDTAWGVVNVGAYTIPTNAGLFYASEDTVCPGDPVEFWFTKTYPSYYVDFGDGNYTTNGNVNHYAIPGMYIASITFINGCGNTAMYYDTVYVVNNHPVTYAPNINSNYSPSCTNQEIDFYIYGNYSSFLWNFGDNTTDTTFNPSHAYALTGTYTVTLTVGNSCGYTLSSTDTVNIVSNIPVSIGTVSIVDTVCVGDGMFYEAGDDQDGNLYLWDFGDTYTSNVRQGSHEYLAPGTYTVTLTASNGCGNSVTSQYPILVGTTSLAPEPGYYQGMLVPENNSCPGDTVVLAFGPAGDSVTVNWLIDNIFPVTATNFIVVNNTKYLYAKYVFTTLGVHTASYVYTNGCGLTLSDTLNYMISPAHQPESDFFFDNTTYKCQGRPIDFYAIGGSTYIWDFGDGSGTLVTYNSLVPVPHAYANAGTYTVKMKVINGCGYSDENSQTIVIPPSLIDITTNSVSSGCSQNNGIAIAIANGGQAPYTYEWSNGNSTFLADSLYSGIYVVTIHDVNGCSNFAIATVSDVQAPTLVVNTVVDVSCFGGSNGAIDINLIGGNAPFTYQWSNGATAQDVNNLVAGPHEVIVTDVNGCVAARSIDVGQPPEVIVSVITSEADCGMNNGNAYANVNGSTGPYSFIWSNGYNTQGVNFLASGIYTVTVVDNNGCIYTNQAIINESNGPDVILDSITGTGCLNNLSSIYIRALNGTTPYSYLWSTGATTQDLLNVALGTYSVVVTGNNGCQGLGYYQITKAAPSAQAICMVTVDTLTGFNQVAWEKDMNATDIDHYNIYKESTQSGLYYLVGAVDYDSLSLWIDPLSDSDVRSWRYKIAVVDDCNNESLWSDEHKTIHLNVNQGIGNSYNLIWDQYEGRQFSSYDIQRYNSISQTWSYLTTVPNNLTSYSDINPPAGTYTYRVDAVINACNPQVRLDQNVNPAAAINNTKSNLKTVLNLSPGGSAEQGGSGTFIVFPNPSQGAFTIAAGAVEGASLIRVSSMLGQELFIAKWEVKPGASKDLALDLPAGMYFISLEINGERQTSRIIIQ